MWFFNAPISMHYWNASALRAKFASRWEKLKDIIIFFYLNSDLNAKTKLNVEGGFFVCFVLLSRSRCKWIHNNDTLRELSWEHPLLCHWLNCSQLLYNRIIAKKNGYPWTSLLTVHVHFFRTLIQEEVGQSSSEEPVEAWTSASSYMLNDEL